MELWLVDDACTKALDSRSLGSSSGRQDPAVMGEWLMSALVRAGEASLRLRRIVSAHPYLIESQMESLPERQDVVTGDDLNRLKTVLRGKGQSYADWAVEQIDGLARTVPREIRSVAERNARIAPDEPVEGDLGHDSLCFLGGALFPASGAGGPLLQIYVGYEVYSECF